VNAATPSPHRLDHAERLVTDDQEIGARRRLAIETAVDLRVGAVDADLEDAHQRRIPGHGWNRELDLPGAAGAHRRHRDRAHRGRQRLRHRLNTRKAAYRVASIARRGTGGRKKESGIEPHNAVESRQSEHAGKLGAGAELEGRRQAGESRTPEQKRRSRALVELPEEKSSAGPEHATDLAETCKQRLIVQVLEDVRGENEVKRSVVERQASRRGSLQADAILQAGPSDLSLADPDQVGRDVDAHRWTDEVDPFGEGDQDVPDPAAEVEHAILARDAGRAKNAPVWGVDHPEAASGKDIPHGDASEATREPLAVAVSHGGLVDVAGFTVHLPQLPAAPRQARPPRSQSTYRDVATPGWPEN